MNFVAIDFELLTHHYTSACSIGMVKVKNGFISEKFYSLINPVPDELTNSEPNFRIHGIPLSNASQCPAFSALFPKIRDFIGNLPIVCHNANTDIRVLHDCMVHFGLSGINTDNFVDTLDLVHCSLDKACSKFDIDLGHHHDALEDAEACAKVFLACKGRPIPKAQTVGFKTDFSHKRIDRPILNAPDLDAVVNRDTPFFASSLVITGTFEAFPNRNELAATLRSLGADVNTAISGKTSVVVMGSGAGWSKVEKIEAFQAKGHDIRIIREDELKEILANI